MDRQVDGEIPLKIVSCSFRQSERIAFLVRCRVPMSVTSTALRTTKCQVAVFGKVTCF